MKKSVETKTKQTKKKISNEFPSTIIVHVFVIQTGWMDEWMNVFFSVDCIRQISLTNNRAYILHLNDIMEFFITLMIDAKKPKKT